VVTPLLVVATMVIVITAYTVKGATGLGSAIVLVALGSLLIGPREAVPLSSALDVVGGAMVLRTVRRVDVDMRIVLLALPGIVVGTALGALTLHVVSGAVLRRLIAAVILGGAGWFAWSRWHGPQASDPAAKTRRHLLPIGAGVAAGFTGGATGVDGPPLVIALGRALDKRALRATLTVVLLLGDLIRLPAFSAIGLLTPRVGVLIGCGIPAAVAGVVLGSVLVNRIPETLFTYVVTGLLVVTTTLLLLR
jgi:uncharacterized membrane protein YfcA